MGSDIRDLVEVLLFREILLFGGSSLGVPYFRKPPHSFRYIRSFRGFKGSLAPKP